MLGYRKPMSPISYFLILFLFNFFLSVHIAFSGHEQQQQQEAVKLDMMHRHHPKVAEKLPGEVKVQGINDRLMDIHDHDHKRQRTISKSLNRTKTEVKMRSETKEADMAIPLSSLTPIWLKMIPGSDFGTSEYFVQLKVGTPPQTFMLIVDTGSDLTWMKCRYRRCIGNCSTNSSHKSRNAQRLKFSKVFLANLSSSFKRVNCSSHMCSNDLTGLFAMGECPTPTSPCFYDYSYAGGPTAKGIFATETLTVGLTNGKETQLHNSIIGCTESVSGKIFDGADGVIGLGTSPYSFTYRADENSHGGGFSYCLVDHLSNHTATSYFVLGLPTASTSSAASSVVPSGNMIFTKLFIGGPYSSFYGVELVGISADGVMLNIPPRVWDINAGGGTILDSGTSLTMLAMPAFDMVMEALIAKLKKFEKIELGPFKFCFNSSNQYSDEMAPKLRLHFGDGAVFEPPPKSYIVLVGDYYCIGLVSLGFPATNIIGNILQQNHLWQFDFLKRKVGFAPSECV